VIVGRFGKVAPVLWRGKFREDATLAGCAVRRERNTGLQALDEFE
jgi:hypothetical protein